MKSAAFAILILFISSFVSGQETAITSSGKKVALKEDGTWTYVEVVNSGTPVFRKVQWGSSKEEVKIAEAKEIDYETDQALIYKTTTAGIDCSAIYVFAKGKFIRGRYFFNAKHSNDNDYIEDFLFLKKTLIAKYGDPIDDEQNWKNTLYKADYSHWGMAIATGDMYYYVNWKTQDTLISLQLWGDNYEIKNVIDYTSLELGILESIEKEEQAKSDL